VPDWRNPADYRYTANLTPHQWAWEFLRRNEQYQAAYAAWRDCCEIVDRRRPYLQSTGDLPSTGSEEAALLDQDIEAMKQLNAAASRAFGLQSPVDPSYPATHPGTLGNWAEAVGVSEIWQGKFYPLVPKPERVGLEFDVTMPLGPQLEFAKAHLRRRQARLHGTGVIKVRKKTSRAQVKLYPTYLRVLDGHFAGVGPWRIGAVVFADLPNADGEQRKDRAISARDAGLALVNDGYRDLLLMASLPKGWK